MGLSTKTNTLSSIECEIMVSDCGDDIRHINVVNISPLLYGKLAKIAVKQNGNNLKYIDPIYRTRNLCILALKHCKNLDDFFTYVPEISKDYLMGLL